MQRPPRGGDGERDPWQIDWSNIDFSTFGRRRQRPGGPPAGVAVFGALLAIVFVVLPLVFGPLVAFLTDLLWFRSLGFEDVYTLRYRAGFYAFAAFFLAFFLFAAVNLYFALRPRARRVVVEGSRPPGALSLTLRLLPLLLIPSFFFGLVGGGEWDVILRWLNGVPFGQTDPLFGRDIGFYFFTLPFLEFVRGWLLAAVVLTAIGVIVVYATRSAAGIATMTTVEAPKSMRDVGSLAMPFLGAARAHLSVLAALFLALVSAGYFLDQFGLLFRQEAVLTGAGYTSVNARVPALTILSVLVGAAAFFALANAFVRTLWLLGGALGLSLVASVLLLGVYPGLVQTFLVNPDPVNRERPYLERHISSTRAAYGLDNVEDSIFDPSLDPEPQALEPFVEDTDAVRLWDWRLLLEVYQQIQGLRQYYAFNDVDVDRYALGGDTERPVMLSARELDVTRLPREARTWQNQHLYYTHGFGVVLTEVGAVTPEGLPRMSLLDIPPRGEPTVDEPRIYYGELTGNYVIVGTTQDEFDFARGEGLDAQTRYAGGGGVGVGGLWDRLLFAVRFGDGNMLVTPQLTAESRVLFHRDITERARLVAPFLAFDTDPYLVVADGKMWWINDAYTTGSGYPYSAYRNGANYFRNSVKLVTNAYDGSMTFYVVDEQDPVIATLRGIYPTLFAKSIEEMPASLRAHVRYPEDLFRIQVDALQTFHMTDPQEFYNRADQWRLATEIVQQGGAPEPIEPYYITATLPDSDRREFILFVPMTPAAGDRDNMVAWIAGRADPPEYGNLRVLRFPKDRLIFGPLQIEARIEADSSIRRELTLLAGGGGANVIRGNLLVIPVGDSFLYIEPLFVQASQGRIPELKRVILATGDRIVMEETFEGALARLQSEIAAGAPPTIPQPGASPTPTPGPTATAAPTAGATPQPTPAGSPGVPTVAQVIREASDHFEAAQAAYAAGDFAEYGRRLELLEQALRNLRALTGQ